jgi:N-hydroxyarylamine O-acetyltransferase
VSSPIDLDAYFERVDYRGPREPTLSVLNALTLAHVRSIPFENLDVLLGRPIDVRADRIFEKLVARRRGGYCFEQNGLFLAVLAALGFEVVPLGARVRIQRPRDYLPARTHLFIRVELEGESWLTDVGVGGLSLSSAIRLELDTEQTTPHEPRRIVREGNRFYHQVRFLDGWNDVYEFTLDEMPLIDREVANWFTSTHPESHFRSRLIVARAGAGGQRLTVADDEFTIRQRDGRADHRRIGSPAELLEILATHFDLHFPPGTQFPRLEPPKSPSAGGAGPLMPGRLEDP